MIIDSKYKKGEVVFERIHPTQKLIINNYTDRLYYCTIPQDHTRKGLVFFERELEADNMILERKLG